MVRRLVVLFRRGLTIAVTFFAVVAATAEAAPAQSSQPADARRHMVVAEFQMAAGSDARDYWMSVALRETIAWRLRRVDGLITVPAARFSQTLRELQSDKNASFKTPDVARLLGARYIVSGVCSAGIRTVSLELTLSKPNQARPETTKLSSERLFDLLDLATHWVLDQLGAAPVNEDAKRLVYSPPAKAASALEYYAKAVVAARSGKMPDVAFYLRESSDSDPAFRETISLRARLALAAGRSGLPDADRAAEALEQLAQRANDPLDRTTAELTRGVLAAATRRPEIAMDRFESALARAYERNDPYMQLAAVGRIVNLLLTMHPPDSADSEAAELTRQYLTRAAEWQVIHLSLVTDLGDLVAMGPSAGKLALIYEQLERWDEALSMYQSAIEAAHQTGQGTAHAGAWMLLGQYYARRKQFSDALDAISRCLTLVPADAQPGVRVVLAGVYEAMDMPTQALGQFQLAYERIREGDDLHDQFACLNKMAPLHKRLGHTADAVATLQEAIDIAHVLKLPEEPKLRKQLEEWKSGAP